MMAKNLRVTNITDGGVIAQAGLVSTGTVDLESVNDIVTGVVIGPDSLVLGTLQERKTGAALGLINLIACEPLQGLNAFRAHLTTAPLANQTVLLGFAVFTL